MALESLGRIDGYDQDGRARRIIVYRRDGRTLLALASRKHEVEATEVDYAAEAAQAFGIRDGEYRPD